MESLRDCVNRAVMVLNNSQAPHAAVAITSGGGADPPAADPAYYTTIGDATEGSEAAETTTWTYGDKDGSDNVKGLRFYAMTRAAYYHAGDKTVYGYVRLIKVDKNGKIYSVGAETRVEIDATEVY